MSIHRIHQRNFESTHSTRRNESTHSTKRNNSNFRRTATNSFKTSAQSSGQSTSISKLINDSSSSSNKKNNSFLSKAGNFIKNKVSSFFKSNKKDSASEDKYKYYDDFANSVDNALKDINNSKNYATTPEVSTKKISKTKSDNSKNTKETKTTNDSNKTSGKTSSKKTTGKTTKYRKNTKSSTGSSKTYKTSSKRSASSTGSTDSTSSTGATSSTKAVGNIKGKLNDPQKLYETLGLKKLGMNYDVFKMAIEGYNNLDSKYKTTGYLGIFDTTQSSKKERYYLINLNTGEIQRSVMKTGSGNMNNVAAANKNGSHATLSGFQQIGEQYYSSKMGKNARRINGLESCNSNARSKSTVAHYTTGEHTWGCLGFTPVYKNGKIDKTATDNKLKSLFPTGAITFTYPTNVSEYKKISKLV